ncbi:hypothetical protein [Saccharothrix algeriensis]|uniref:Ig-like domain-containing protein n=1 Tax=Saccharothrix algeriensis TaxID=173560 RepID=A0A8T8HZ22_9PSEU|nr:hypothetical protein [Saccharothrix algeriensis]MBM7814705.1 hypothetical protein [Saccharothrix algeriensis]QTR02994.1 hypothetical protein J7S33_29050 [Saccharothrix algeriensis]
MRLRSLFVAAVVVLSSVVGSSLSPASASVVDVNCPLGTQDGTYYPGMTLLPRHIDFTATGTLGGCLSPAHPEITGATFTTLATGTFSCLSGSTSNTSTYHWNTGQSSTVEGGFEINLKPGGTTVLVLTGTVVSGLFEGATVVQTKVLPATDLTACLTPQGLTGVSGATTFTAVL